MDTVKKQAAMQAIETSVVRQQAIEKEYDRLLAMKLSYLKELETLASSSLHAKEAIKEATYVYSSPHFIVLARCRASDPAFRLLVKHTAKRNASASNRSIYPLCGMQ